MAVTVRNARNAAFTSTPGKAAFTLIELLVVIAIIAILAAILFPVFAQAREKARQTSCISNMKQVTLGLIMYQQDFDETVPFNRECSNPGGPACTDGTRYMGWVDLVNPYVKNLGVFKCPSDPVQPIPVGNQPAWGAAGPGQGIVWGANQRGGDFRSSYARNNNLANNGTNTATLAQIQFPVSTILVFEFAANSGGGANGNERGTGSAFTIVRSSAYTSVTPAGVACAMYDPTNATNNRTNFFGSLLPNQQQNERAQLSSARHSGGANYGFVDGHAKWFRPEQVRGQCGWSWAGNPSGSATEYGNDGNIPDFRL